ncbi:MAG: cysteine--tRNA ligase, partial [Planctomycetota bacterium]
TLRELSAILGLFKAPVAKTSAASDGVVVQLMRLMMELRADARGRKDFATADKVRQSLSEIGVLLEDRKGGTEWRVGP